MLWKIAILGLAFAPLPEPARTQPVANQFAISYNTWVELHRSAQPGILNAKEVEAWAATKASWKQLDKLIKY